MMLAVLFFLCRGLSVTVTPFVSVEPATIHIRVCIEHPEEWRFLAIEIESSNYLRTSTQAVSRRLYEYDQIGVPAGDYVVTARVTNSPHSLTDHQTIRVVERLHELAYCD